MYTLLGAPHGEYKLILANYPVQCEKLTAAQGSPGCFRATLNEFSSSLCADLALLLCCSLWNLVKQAQSLFHMVVL